MRVMSHVEEAEVLDIGPVSDPDEVHVASDDSVKPHA